MSEARPDVAERRERSRQDGDADRAAAADLEALRLATARDVPTMHSVLRAAQAGSHREEGGWMAAFKGRPWVSAAVAGAMVVVALLVIPVSYMKVTGHQVALSVSGASITPDRLRGIAGEMKQALHADGVRVEAQAKNGDVTYTLASTVPAGTGVDAGAAAKAFAGELNRLGYQATADVTPVVEKVTGSVYAYARDQVIRVSVDGKSASQIESEIRSGLAAAGITNAQVNVTEADGGKKLQVKVEAKRTSNDGREPTEAPRLELTRNGQPMAGGKGFTIREEKRKGPDGVTLSLEVNAGDKHATIEIPHVDTMSDAAITQTVQQQLAAAGIQASVTVTDGRVEIREK
jgi:hypothetical protein